MDKQHFIHYLKNPSTIRQEQMRELKTIIDKYPYFQSVKPLYLKALKNQESFRYNNELKITAAYTTNRTILFDFITSNVFTNSLSEEKNKAILKEKSKKIVEAKQNLQIGKPLIFNKSEKHSFNQWLQLSVNKPVDRKNSPKKNQDNKSLQNQIINKFIETNPKIPRVNKNTSLEVKIHEKTQPSQLMTETLARVYLEQKKYKNAIKAYEILSLKYPEKSGFFANQIKQIQILQNPK